MNAITKGIRRLVPLVRNTICTRRSAITRAGKNSRKFPKIGNNNSLKISTSFIQCRFYSDSKVDSVHQRTLIREWNAIGVELSEQHRWSEALEAFNKVLSTDKTNIRALAGKALSCCNLNQFQAAMDCYELILDLGEATAPIFLGRGVTRCQLEQYDEALEDFKRVRKLDPEETSQKFWGQLGADIDAFGPKTIEIYRRAVKQFPNDSMLCYYLGTCYLKFNRFAEAEEALKHAVEMEPNNFDYLLALGRVEFGLKNWKEASTILDKCIELGNEDNDDLWMFKLEAQYHMGNDGKSDEMFVDTKKRDDVIKFLRKFHEKNPNDVATTFQYARMLEPKQALPFFEELTRTAPSEQTWSHLGDIYLELGQYEKSVEAFDRAVAIEDHWYTRSTQASAYVHLRQYDKENQTMHRLYELLAIEGPAHYAYFPVLPLVIRWQYNQALHAIDEFLAKQPQVFDGWNVRATLLKEMGRETDALESVEKGLKLEQHVSVYCQKIDILGTFGRFDEAFELIKHAETLLPEEFDQMHVMYHLTVGVTLHKQGKYEQALEHINKSIDNMDKATNIDIFRFQYWVEKAKALEALKRIDEAIVNYEYALSILPEEPYSLLHLAKLYRETGRDSEARALVPRLAALNTDVESFNKEVAELLSLLK